MAVRGIGSLIVAWALLVGSAVAQDPASLPREAVQLIQGGPRQWFGDARPAIQGAFGRPDRIELHTVRNRHDSTSVDTIVTLRYRTATYVFYTVTKSHGDILLEGTIWDSRYLKRSPIRLGATVSEVRGFFHDTSRGSTPHMTYSTDFSGMHTLELWFENDRLVRMRWVYPID
jgi:hypothetical protein